MRKLFDYNTIIVALVIALLIIISAFARQSNNNQPQIVSYVVNCKKQNLAFYWKDEKGNTLKNLQGLINYTKQHNKNLVFGMNAGMYMENNTPLGLYIEDGVQKTPLNKRSGSGNFYLQPNGVLYITKNKEAFICTTPGYKNTNTIQYATQSGPMLLHNGEINSNFTKGSQNLNIRNGVGVLPDNTLVFAMSKTGINFYDFALYFKNLGCKNALYLDGFVSRCFVPSKNWKQYDGNFGAMIGVTE